MLNLAKYEEAIINCRFCFMCRHLSPVSNVTGQEADTPRVRAASYYSILRGFAPLNDEELISRSYQAALSRACCHHCCQYKRANHDDRNFDENGMILAFRQDIVEAGVAPEAVKKLAAEYKDKKAPEISGKSGDTLYFLDEMTQGTPAIALSFAKIMKSVNVPYRTAKGGCTGKALKVLGFVKEAKAAAKKFVNAINASGAKTLVVSNPAAYDALTNDLAEYGITLKLKVMHVSEFLLTLPLKFKKKAGTLYYLESDFLKNYAADYSYPHRLLKAAGAKEKSFGTNDEESYTCGEGAVLFHRIAPGLVRKLAAYVAERADHPAKDLIVTASPCTRVHLPVGTGLHVVTLEELVAGLI